MYEFLAVWPASGDWEEWGKTWKRMASLTKMRDGRRLKGEALGLMSRDATQMTDVWAAEIERIRELWGVQVGAPSAVGTFNMVDEIEARGGAGSWVRSRAGNRRCRDVVVFRGVLRCSL